MPHESTVNPEEPMDFKSWGEEKSQSNSKDYRRSNLSQVSIRRANYNHALSIQTHPDLPLHVTHDHDDDGDPDDDNSSVFDNDLESDLAMTVTYTPPKKKL